MITDFSKTFTDIISISTELDPVFYRVMKFLVGQKIAAVTDRSPLALQMARSNVTLNKVKHIIVSESNMYYFISLPAAAAMQNFPILLHTKDYSPPCRTAPHRLCSASLNTKLQLTYKSMKILLISH